MVTAGGWPAGALTVGAGDRNRCNGAPAKIRTLARI